MKTETTKNGTVPQRFVDS